MADKRAPGRSLDEWMKLVTECRQSGLTDAAWCTEHGISPSSFYNAVIIPGISEPPARTLRATVPENERHIFR